MHLTGASGYRLCRLLWSQWHGYHVPTVTIVLPFWIDGLLLIDVVTHADGIPITTSYNFQCFYWVSCMWTVWYNSVVNLHVHSSTLMSEVMVTTRSVVVQLCRSCLAGIGLLQSRNRLRHQHVTAVLTGFLSVLPVKCHLN